MAKGVLVTLDFAGDANPKAVRWIENYIQTNLVPDLKNSCALTMTASAVEVMEAEEEAPAAEEEAEAAE